MRDDKARNLRCCVCGDRFIGYQWSNQDTGHGLGPCCAGWVWARWADPEWEPWEGLCRTYGPDAVKYAPAEARDGVAGRLREEER